MQIVNQISKRLFDEHADEGRHYIRYSYILQLYL